MELQETLLESIMDIDLAQGIKTMVANVLSATKVAGGIYYACHRSNLNGLCHGGAHSSSADCVNWYAWKGFYYSLKFTEMKIRF